MSTHSGTEVKRKPDYLKDMREQRQAKELESSMKSVNGASFSSNNNERIIKTLASNKKLTDQEKQERLGLYAE